MSRLRRRPRSGRALSRAGVAALLVAACASPPPGEVQASANAAASESRVGLLASGPMLGHVGPERARVWVQGGQRGWVWAEYRREGEDWRRARHFDGREARTYLHPDQDYAGVCELPGLEPGSRYEYRIRREEGLYPAPNPQRFRTPPRPGQAEDLVVGFGSCAGDWGEDASQPVWRAVHAQRPDLFLWLGDNIYFRLQESEWLDPAAMAERWRIQRGLDSLQPLLAGTAHYATWDDHDYGPNDSDKGYARKFDSLELFQRYWANPGAGSGGAPGVWHRFRRGQVEFFLLDGRFHREPQSQEPDAHKTQFGEAQWRWLEAALRESDAAFKVLASPSQVLADYHSYEGWWAYPADRERLYRLAAEAQIDGLVLISGDRHIGEVLVGERLGYPLYEFCSSPLAAGIGSRPPDDLPMRLPGTLVTVENFGLLRFEFGAVGGPRLRYQAHDVEGRALHPEVVVPLSALQWPRGAPAAPGTISRD